MRFQPSVPEHLEYLVDRRPPRPEVIAWHEARRRRKEARR